MLSIFTSIIPTNPPHLNPRIDCWNFQELWVPAILRKKNSIESWIVPMALNILYVSDRTKKFSSTLLGSSLQFSRSVVSDSLWPHRLQHIRLPCPSPTPWSYSNSCPLSQWCHLTISSSVGPFSYLQPFPASGSFQMSQFFTSGGQSIGVSASASVLPMNIQGWFPLRWTVWIPLQSKGLSSLLQHHSSKASILRCSAFLIVQLSHPYMTTGKTIALTKQTFVGKVMSLLFNMLSRLVITFLPRSKCLLISWQQSPSAVILEPPKIKSLTVFIVSPSICHEVMRPDAMILVFWMLNFKPTFSLSSFTFIKRLFSSSLLSAIRVVSSAYLRLLIFLPASLAFHMMYSAYKFNKQGNNSRNWSLSHSPLSCSLQLT